MVLFSTSSYGGVEKTRRKNMKLKKDLWINEDGEVKESNNGLPKGWAKGKLVGRAGDEISDVQAKEYGISKETKAKKPAENK